MWINTLWPSESVQAKPGKQTQAHPSTTRKERGKPKEDMSCLLRVLCVCGFSRGNCTQCPPGGRVWGACTLARGNLLKEDELNSGSWNIRTCCHSQRNQVIGTVSTEAIPCWPHFFYFLFFWCYGYTHNFMHLFHHWAVSTLSFVDFASP